MGGRRRTLRLHCDLLARWRSRQHAGMSHVLDMSAGGMLLAGVGVLSPGDHVDVVVELEGRRIELDAEVRFVGNTRYGFGAGVAIASSPTWEAHYHRLAEHTIDSAPISIRQYLRRRTEPATTSEPAPRPPDTSRTPR